MAWYTDLDRWIREELPALKVLCEEPLSGYTSFRIGGAARRIAFPQTAEETQRLFAAALSCGAAPLVMGNGTNLLFSDAPVDRLIISTDALCRMVRTGETEVSAEAGVPLARLAVFAQQNGLAGLAFAHGIPGSTGGGVCMNAGAYGGEIKDVLAGASVLTEKGEICFMPAEELALGYRRSYFTDHSGAVVLQAEFHLQPGDPEEIRREMESLMQRRKSTQPLEYPSAGSTFKRPPGYFAGALIEQAGCKGLAVGDAQVSEKHAGFIVNRGHATGEDVRRLIELVQRRVLEQSGVSLEPEVRIID